MPQKSQSPLLVQYALAQVELVKRQLEIGRGIKPDGGPRAYLMQQRTAIHELAKALTEARITPPDVIMALRYGLQPWERDLIWVLAAPELDPTLRDEIARFNDNVLKTQVDISLCQALLAETPQQALALRSSLQAGGALRSSGLFEILPPRGQHKGFLSQELLPAEDVVSALYGLRALSSDLHDYAELFAPSQLPSPLSTPQQQHLEELSQAIAGFFAQPPLNESNTALGLPTGAAILVHSAQGSGRRVALRAIASSLKRRIIALKGGLLARAPFEHARKIIARLAREAELHGELVLLTEARPLIEAHSPLALPIAATLQHRRALFVFLQEDGSPIDPTLERSLLLRHAFSAHGSAQFTEDIWRATLGLDTLTAEIEEVAKRWSLSPLQARKAAHLHQLWSHALDEDEKSRKLSAEKAAQMQIPFEAGSFAVLTHPSVGFDDLILDEDTGAQIHAICDAVMQRDRVLRDWKLARRIRRGLGITCLFDGEPGTGKTLSAEVIAATLGFGLLRINISTIVDKYIGETEKNLHRIFESARPDTSILLFDEADSIFAKRTEVQHSNDRYSNMNVNVLLQLIEAYEGVAILTTNLKQNMDEAFERRIMFKVHFELPEEAQRAQIWRRLLPPYIPMQEELDLDALGEIELSGGEIKNTIVKAAYAAARQDQLLNNDILIEMAYAEARAAGRLIREELDIYE